MVVSMMSLLARTLNTGTRMLLLPLRHKIVFAAPVEWDTELRYPLSRVPASMVYSVQCTAAYSITYNIAANIALSMTSSINIKHCI